MSQQLLLPGLTTLPPSLEQVWDMLDMELVLAMQAMLQDMYTQGMLLLLLLLLLPVWDMLDMLPLT